jgi:P4 family phage/plasmid primase-like protien
VEDGWQSLTADKMSDPAYLAKLNHGGNIGVLLGKNSGGVCTIDIDRDEAVEQFLELQKPQIREALRTRRVRGGNVWLRIRGAYPSSAKLKTTDGEDWGEWRANGNQTVIYGKAIDPKKGETEPTKYRIVRDGPVVMVPFDEIVWPDDLILPWKDAALITKYGEPLIKDDTNRVALNQCYFVGRFAEEHNVLHEAAEGQFYEYNHETGLWTPKTTDAVKKMFGEDFHRMATEWNQPGIIRHRTNSLLAALAELLRGEAERQGVFENREPVIHVANGMLHLDCDPPELRPFAKSYYSRNQSPIVFDEKAECPRFVEELLNPALDPDDASLLQRWAGLCLLGRNQTQRLALITGTPGGGKSTVVSIIERVVGQRNVAELRTNLLLDRFELFSFVGKTLLTAKDVPADFLCKEGATVIKKLCGGDLIDAEGKSLNSRIQMKGHFNIAITCNSRLRIRLEGDAGAWSRRILPINYEKPKPPRPIRDFEEMLIRQEGPGILNWMIEGAVAHLMELEECGDFKLADRQRARVEALLCESDSVRFFVRSELEADEASDLTTDEIIRAYCDFCERRGWDALARRTVENQLPDLMLEKFRAAKRNDVKRHDKAQRGFAGVRIKSEAATPCP